METSTFTVLVTVEHGKQGHSASRIAKICTMRRTHEPSPDACAA